MMRFGQKLTTSMRSSFFPARTAPARSTRKGGAHTTPHERPFTNTSANSRTNPKSNHRCVPCAERS